MRVAEVHLHVNAAVMRLCRQLGASVPGQAVPEELGQFPYSVDDVLLDVSGVVPVRQVQQDRDLVVRSMSVPMALWFLAPVIRSPSNGRYRPVLDLLEALRDLGHGNRDLRSPSPRVYVIK